MSTPNAEMDALKTRLKSMWMAGDFGQIAKQIESSGEEFIARLNLKPGDRVLDVACGSGNLAIPAARTGAIDRTSRSCGRRVRAGRLTQIADLMAGADAHP